MKKRTLSLILTLALIFAFGCASATNAGGNQTGLPKNARDIGQGGSVFAFEVTDNNKMITEWNVHTDEATVGAALLAVELIKGDASEYGLYVKEVNGLKADYDTDRAYWAFYVDGEYAVTGVDAANIEPGKIYAFVYTKD